MVKYSLRRNYFGNVAVILIHNVEFKLNNMKKLIGVFAPEYCVTKILALDRDDTFFNTVSDERYNIIFPKFDTITSETIIISNVADLLSAFEPLISSEPRCVSIYEIKKQDSLYNKAFDNEDEYLIKKEIVDYSISMIIEECCVKITFNANRYNPKELLRSIKETQEGPI